MKHVKIFLFLFFLPLALLLSGCSQDGDIIIDFKTLTTGTIEIRYTMSRWVFKFLALDDPQAESEIDYLNSSSLNPRFAGAHQDIHITTYTYEQVPFKDQYKVTLKADFNSLDGLAYLTGASDIHLEKLKNKNTIFYALFANPEAKSEEIPDFSGLSLETGSQSFLMKLTFPVTILTASEGTITENRKTLWLSSSLEKSQEKNLTTKIELQTHGSSKND